MVETTGNSSMDTASPERDALYYLMPITIQVEDCLFKVPRNSFMQNSPIFRDMVSIPQGSISYVEGSSDSHPLKLDVNKEDFRQLLKVLFPLDIPPGKTMSKDGWIAVLRLSSMWEMDKVRELAITNLTSSGMGSVEKIVLAKEFHVPQWLRSGYQELVNRQEMLSMEESERISYKSATGVFQVRESTRNRNQGYYGGMAKVLTIEGVFEVELAMEKAYYETYATGSSIQV
ncbi:hypothetical protein D9615_006037 [Tricholomella constricta]|uniref:BTB domain-containing protein n=1 Tax=Tricholomella constricta TaxID=117010 RepID=A0A8H5H9K3_9AGAR|nr:hypothetical protein D9615_006037 [Tricholomella constricta]